MRDEHKDKLTDLCDDRDWRVTFDRRGCDIETSNGATVEYAEDSDARTVKVTASGRRKTILAVLKAIDEAAG